MGEWETPIYTCICAHGHILGSIWYMTYIIYIDTYMTLTASRCHGGGSGWQTKDDQRRQHHAQLNHEHLRNVAMRGIFCVCQHVRVFVYWHVRVLVHGCVANPRSSHQKTLEFHCHWVTLYALQPHNLTIRLGFSCSLTIRCPVERVQKIVLLVYDDDILLYLETVNLGLAWGGGPRVEVSKLAIPPCQKNCTNAPCTTNHIGAK